MSENNIDQKNPTESGEKVSIPELDEFIFEPDEFREEIVPRKLSAPDVAKYLIQKLDKNTKLKAFEQAEKVADFYDSTEIVETYKQFLDKKESDSESVRRSIVIARIIAILGNAEDVNFAKDYYKYLIQKLDTLDDFIEITFLHEALNLGLDSSLLRKKYDEKVAVLEKKKGDFQGELEYLKFQETVVDKIQRAEKVQAVKDKILNNKDRKTRIEDEIKMYVTTEFGFQEFLPKWSARRIRRETFGAQIAEQTKRTDNIPLKEDVAKLLRVFLMEKADSLKLQEDEKQNVRVKILRAIKFFNGKMLDGEEDFLRLFKGKQVDILANEGFMIKD